MRVACWRNRAKGVMQSHLVCFTLQLWGLCHYFVGGVSEVAPWGYIFAEFAVWTLP